MPKRPCSDNDDGNALKKQAVVDKSRKCREIRSISSERTLQLLYKGANRLNENRKDANETNCKLMHCSCCSKSLLSKAVCNYCERYLCGQCSNLCYKCNEEFCANCSFPTYDQNEAACLACYK